MGRELTTVRDEDLERGKAKERQRLSEGRGKRGGKLPHLKKGKSRDKIARLKG